MDLPVIFDGLTRVSVTTWIMIITVCVLVLRLFSPGRASSPPLPPSPRFRLPVLGHLLQLNMDLRITFRKFRKRFGDVYSYYLGSRYVVVIAGFETLNEAFKTRSLFVDRAEIKLLDIVTRKAGIINVNGDVWRDHRKFAMVTLKDFGLGRSILEDKINAETKLLIHAMRMMEGKPFDPRQLLTTAVSNIICSITFGHTFKHNDPKFTRLTETFTDLSTTVANAGLANVLPFLENVPGDPWSIQKVVRYTDERFAFIREIVDEHMANYDENVIEDYTSAFIKVMKQKQLDDEPTHFTPDQLCGVISDLFIAGTETTTTVLRWSLVCLITFPETQTRMYDVISKHVGTERLPALENKAALSYVEAFYTEVLRYCDIAIGGLLYGASTDVELNGYKIPKGSIIFPDMDSVLSDRHIWGDPENFRPDRFLDEDGSIRTQEEFISFFMGKRRCLGEAMARMELFLFISAMVQNYIFESPDVDQVSVRSVDGIFGVVHAPKPFRIVARARQA